MEIKIKAIGHRIGTIGWLKHGIESGEISFREAKTKKGSRPGLKMYTPELPEGMWIALKNPFNFSGADLVAGWDEIEIVTSDGGGWGRGDEIGCTAACWHAIKDIAKAYKAEMEAREEAEKDITIKVIIEEALG